MKSLIYIRVSTELQTEGTSLDKQRDWALSQADGEPYEIFEELGRSGESIEGRPAFKRVIGLIESGYAEGAKLYAYDQDRLSRSMSDWALIARIFTEHDIYVVTNQGDVDFSKRDQRLTSNIKGALSDWHLAYIREESIKGKAAMMNEGFFHGGLPPRGLRLNYSETIQTKRGKKRPTIEPEPDYIEAIESVFIMAKDHSLGFMQIADRLKPIDGKILDSNQVGLILRQPLYAGHVRRNGKLIKCPQVKNPIIPLDMFIEANGERKPSPKRQNPVKYLLTPFLECGYCKGRMHGCASTVNKKNVWRGYRCVTNQYEGKRGCSRNKSHTAGHIESLLYQHIQDLLSSPHKLKASYKKHVRPQCDRKIEIDRIDGELNLSLHYMDNLVGEVALGVIGFGPEFKARVYRQIKTLEDRIRQLKLQKRRLEATDQSISVEAIIDIMKRLPCEDRHLSVELIDTLIDKIIIYKHRMIIQYNSLGRFNVTIPTLRRSTNK